MGRKKKESKRVGGEAQKDADRTQDDRDALREAFAGVKPLSGGAKRVRPSTPPPATSDPRGSRVPRAAIEPLIVEHHGGRDVIGQRAKTHSSILNALEDPQLDIEAECDLHRMTAVEAEREILRFVTWAQKQGLRWVLVIAGKGLHSPGGKGTLHGHVVRSLSEGRAARYVLAFRTAPRRHGGSGAFTVRLVDRL